MGTELDKVVQLLFGQAGLRASNFKMFPGTPREVVPEDVSTEIAGSINRIANGELEEIDCDAIL